ncbi:hypothetical protein EHE19_018015 [Ruminiclostridium herbifermentans]|uniref:Uncharacterized protein n=1 Tax=Ruminiclostridium herbifermentans TaxID=2488810 RepID=A0A4U7JKE0_9FIRM|nr:BRO family protein [Ruminiclostridium herbifermentans]QNU66711.1 hypothetical protein EHE19_018015 [Ruminiclostridium herbifermentans]
MSSNLSLGRGNQPSVIHQVFNFEGSSIKGVMIDGEPWFVARDVAEALGYETLQRMYGNVEREDKKEINPQSLEYQGLCKNSTTFRLMIINESGLYDAIFGSILPSAKRFKKWVTSEVLPQIRKTGSYIGYQAPRTFKEALILALQQQEQIEQLEAEKS